MTGRSTPWNWLKTALHAGLVLVAGAVSGQHEAGTAHGSDGHDTHTTEKKPFSAGELIMEHIGDAHSFHVVGHLSVPLPVILWTEGGLEVFSSSNLMGEHHEPVPYKGKYHTYLLEHEKIKVLDAAGHIDANASVLDLSITKNVFSLLLCVTLLLVVFIGVAKAYTRSPGQAPRGLQSLLEPVILFVRDNIAKSAIGGSRWERWVPYLLTLFFFIWFANLMGLIPIFPFGANVTGNIVTPLVLATITLLIVTFVANWHYWRHMLAMPGIPIPVLLILTPIEIMGHFIRPIVLMIRLFANIMAGHIVLLVFFCLIFIFSKNGESLIGGYATGPFALLFTVFVNCLELLVAALQAYVFTLLTAIYIGTATHEAHAHDHH